MPIHQYVTHQEVEELRPSLKPFIETDVDGKRIGTSYLQPRQDDAKNLAQLSLSPLLPYRHNGM